MGWWQTGLTGEDEIGDQPVDLLENALESLAQGRRSAHQPLPDRATLFTALARALPLPESCLDVSGIRGLEVRARDTAPERYTIDSPAPDPHVQSVMSRVLQEIAGAYDAYLSRPPRVSEIGAIFAFVLRQAPERFLSDVRNWELSFILPLESGAPGGQHS